MDEKLVVVAQYDTGEMAHVDRDILNDAGIDAFIENETLSMAGLYYPLATCRVKLLVRQNDEEQARKILQEIQDSETIEEESESTDFDESAN